MRGKRFIRLEVERVEYNFELERKITIIKGNSATGKTTFVEAVSAWIENGRKSGVKLVSDSSVFVLNKTNWRDCLSKKGCILIADEGFDIILYKDFSSLVNESDNYFLFVSRSGRLKYLTYSINSILELNSSRVGTKVVTTAYNYYFDNLIKVKPSICITEDSNSCKEMFSLLLSDIGVESAKGKDNVYNIVSKELDKGRSDICIIVDGSAFGSCMGKFDKILTKVHIIAPESLNIYF